MAGVAVTSPAPMCSTLRGSPGGMRGACDTARPLRCDDAPDEPDPRCGDGPDRVPRPLQGHHARDAARRPGARLDAARDGADGPLPRAGPGPRPSPTRARVRRRRALVRGRARRGRPARRERHHPDEEGSAVRHGLRLHDVPARTRRGRGRAGLQPALEPQGRQREAVHRLVPRSLPAHAGDGEFGAAEGVRDGARRRDRETARRHGRRGHLPPPPGRPEPQHRAGAVDARGSAADHGAALRARDPRRRQARAGGGRGGGRSRAGPHTGRRGDARQPRRGRSRRTGPDRRERAAHRRARRPGAPSSAGSISSGST